MSTPVLAGEVKSRLREINNLRIEHNQMIWQQDTLSGNSLPIGFMEVKARRAKLIQEKLIDPLFYELVGELASRRSASYEDRRLARALISEINHERMLPADFISRRDEILTQAYRSWMSAKSENDFSLVHESLEEVLKIEKERADYLGHKNNPFDALLGYREEGLTSDRVSNLFSQLRDFLVPFVTKVRAVEERIYITPKGNFPIEKQRLLLSKLSKVLGLRSIGIDFTDGHPATHFISPKNIRVAVRRQSKDLLKTIGDFSHEAGHALLRSTQPSEYFGTWLSGPRSISIDEGVARMIENIVCRGVIFCDNFYPTIEKIFPDPFNFISKRRFYEIVNRAGVSRKRIDADELTYDLFVIILYDLGKDLIEGRLQVTDLREAFNERTREDLGFSPVDDANGVLADIFWYQGAFALPPLYTLGNIYGAQLFSTFIAEMGETTDLSAYSESLLKWLTKKVFRAGRGDAVKLVEQATGHPPTIEFYKNYLRVKFCSLHGINI